MYKIMGILALSICFSSTARAEVTELDVLKATPATKYELGMFQLQLMAQAFNHKYSGERVNGTKFDIKDLNVIESNDSFGLIFSYEGRSKYMTVENCIYIHDEKTKKTFSPALIVEKLWPSLSNKQHEQLMKNVSLSTQLVDEDNASFTQTCGS
ncbi:hypothetical protein [Photobacterium rosenbergii]|uniref:Uncharacterized protein n=1 Tax=Photobacterium rosenbergii TaxID=294936 RepID=A0ABU3ZC86_9GAMM|nr:hypothetical protein [Photobacterium rosenbergii]MDV5167518.1 hypothetical protein [Photobacterium rosenbergii]